MAGEVKNMIAVDGLRFSYTDRPLLSDLSFEVPEGRFLAIAGPNGAGKSTLVNLICGLLKPQGGIIRIDGREIGDYSTAQIARKVSVVRQEFVPSSAIRFETVLMAYAITAALDSSRPRIAGLQLGPWPRQARQDLAMRPWRRSAAASGNGCSSHGPWRANPVLLLDEPTSYWFYDMVLSLRVFSRDKV